MNTCMRALRWALAGWLAGVLAGVLAGCASTPDPAFHPLARFAQLPADQRAGLVLPFDAYVVGIEKDNRSRVGAMPECPETQDGPDCLRIAAPYFRARPTLQARLRATYANQHRPTFVSHIARFDGGNAPCFVANRHDSTLPCPGVPAQPDAASAVAGGVDALRGLGSDLDTRLQQLKPTHVIVYSMGWNTDQREALDNFRRLVAQLVAAARQAGDARFRPLVIGLTWPSTGSPTIPAADYPIKANDADEVGSIWANLLINRELRRLKGRHAFRLVVVGHSFGARLTSRAVFSAPLVSADDAPVVDLLIGLQGAYSFQRFLAAADGDAPEGQEGAPYRDHAGRAGLVALTTSRWDTAVTSFGHARHFVGSGEVFQRTLDPALRDAFAHGTLGADGRLSAPFTCHPSRVLMLDASAVIMGNEPGTGGGAHSVIYSEQIGRMTHQLISACAP